MSDALSWLRRVPVFAQADGRALTRAAARSEVRFYAREKQVVRAGSAQTHVLIVAQGALHLYRQNREAKTQLLIAVVPAPATFGDAELYAHAPWMVSAKSVADTVIVHMPNAIYDALISEDGRVAAALYREACARILLAVQVTQVHGLQKVRHKVLRLLWERAPAPTKPGPRAVRIAQVELAEALGVTTKTVQRNLKELEADGLIRRDGPDVTLLVREEDLPWTPLRTTPGGAHWRLPEEG